MVWLFLLYALVVIALALARASHSTGDQFLMGNRNASALLVGAALFTLVGGGELVTLTALAFTYGLGALALFVGYAAGFIALAALARRVRAHTEAAQYLSLPDYIHTRYGRVAGHITFLVSFCSFLALLVVQFIAAGELLAPLLGFSYASCLVATAGVTLLYLLLGGFETVLLTDLLQAGSRLLLVPLLLAAGLAGGDVLVQRGSESLPLEVGISLVITGLFSAASSADVWQRIYAARDIRAARFGLIGGATAMLLFGALLVAVGLIARNAGVTTDPNQAFGAVMTKLLPPWAGALAILLVLSTVMSTADTEMFLTGGLLSREIGRLGRQKTASEVTVAVTVHRARLAVALCSVVAIILALLVRDLVLVYTWLISALLVIAPTVIGSLFVSREILAGRISLILNAILFTVLAVTGAITPETAYYVLLPGFAVYLSVLVFSRASRSKRGEPFQRRDDIRPD